MSTLCPLYVRPVCAPWQVTIRGLGGLLSAHALAARSAALGAPLVGGGYDSGAGGGAGGSGGSADGGAGGGAGDSRSGGGGGYDGGLLRLAEDLAQRLMPAFRTPSGLPAAWVNLRSGGIAGDTRDTCTAGAGTLLLEMATLSAFTGNASYEAAASRALHALCAAPLTPPTLCRAACLYGKLEMVCFG